MAADAASRWTADGRFDLLGPLPAARVDDRAGGQRGYRQDVRVGRSGHPLHRRGRGDAGPDAADHVRPGGHARSCATACAAKSSTRSAAFDDPSTGRRQPGGRASARPATPTNVAIVGSGCATRWPPSTPPTIATTHQFCQMVLKSLGVAGDTDTGVTLVESLDELVAEIVDDLYLRHFGLRTRRPAAEPRRRAAAGPRGGQAPGDGAAAEGPAAGLARRGVRRLRERRSGRTGSPQAAARHPRLRRPAHPAGRCAGGRRLAGPAADASAVADRDGRRVPGHRPGAVEGDRPRVHRPLHADPDRRPEAGHLRVPRRRHRHLPQGRGNRWRAKDSRQELAQRRRPGEPPADAAGRRTARRPSGSSCTRSRRSITAHGSRAPRATTRSGCGS